MILKYRATEIPARIGEGRRTPGARKKLCGADGDAGHRSAAQVRTFGSDSARVRRRDVKKFFCSVPIMTVRCRASVRADKVSASFRVPVRSIRAFFRRGVSARIAPPRHEDTQVSGWKDENRMNSDEAEAELKNR